VSTESGQVQTLEQWEKIITTPNIPERDITGFLRRHAGLFFHLSHDYPFVLSEIRLGSDFVVDFALPEDMASEGTKWHLIEVEMPSTPPFKKNGDKSARLSHALDQIELWKGWLRRRTRMIQDLFPCNSWILEASLQFHIVIGTRENTAQWIERRNELSSAYGVHIRSFDWLSRCLANDPRFYFDESVWEAHDKKPFAPLVSNALANPLYEAFSHAQWTTTLRDCVKCDRIMDLNADIILRHRPNSGLFSEFAAYCQNHPRAYKRWLQEFQNRYP
jgi:hypothetical protein